MNSSRTLTDSFGGHWRRGQGSAPCPVCQPERRKDQNALSLKDYDGRVLLHCFKSGCSYEDIVGAVPLPMPGSYSDRQLSRQIEQKRTEHSATKLTKARSLWNAAEPIAGTAAQTYLKGRGITIPLPGSLRFLPETYHGPSGQNLCAMVADVHPTGGIHRTYLTLQGEPITGGSKMMLGPCAGGAVRLSVGAGPLVVCEGIETGLSLVQGLIDRSPLVWASLSTSGMTSLNLPSRSDALIVAMDNDKNGSGQQAASDLADRATAQGWTVSIMDPGVACDFNDVLVGGR